MNVLEPSMRLNLNLFQSLFKGEVMFVSEELAAIVDEFGELKRQVDELSERQEQLRRQLIDAGKRLILGNKFVATFSESPRRNTKWAALIKELDVPQTLVDKFTDNKIVTYVTCTVRE